MEPAAIPALLKAVSYLSEGDIIEIKKAYEFAARAHAHQKRTDGSPYVTHCIAVAEIVAGWKADPDTIMAALLHDVLEDTEVTKAQLVQEFGRSVSLLVTGITKFTQADLSREATLDRKIETLRRLFEVMRQDLRVAMIKLADRLHNVCTIDTLPTVERRVRFAKETLNVYYKLAGHLGMREIRRAYAEHCVPYVFGETGTASRELRDGLCVREKGIIDMVREDLSRDGSDHSLISLYMQKRNLLVFHQCMEESGQTPSAGDAFSVVVVVDNEEGCYRLLKTLHTHYRPVSGKFRDFIAAPSDAGYQSIHTHVMLPMGGVIEVRILTPGMLQQATRGAVAVAFKDGAYLPVPGKYTWLQRSEDLDLSTRDSSSAFWEALESDILKETISVTIDRRRISLPKGATVLDAAYAMYRTHARFIRHLNIDGKPVPFAHEMKDEDELYSAFVSRDQVTFEWLRCAMTRFAKSMIIEVLKERGRAEKLALGNQLIQKEFDYYRKGLVTSLSRSQLAQLCRHFHRADFEEVVAMIGEGVIRPRDVVFTLFPEQRPHWWRWSMPDKYPFRLRVSGTYDGRTDILVRFSRLVRSSPVHVRDTRMNIDPKSGMFTLIITGVSPGRMQFADFIDDLDRQEWTSKVDSIITRENSFMLAGLFAAELGAIMAYVLALAGYWDQIKEIPFLSLLTVYSWSVVPVLVLNYYFLRFLRNYLVHLRNEYWYLGLGFGMNVFGVLLVAWKLPVLSSGISILIVLFAITLSMLVTGYRFVQTIY